MQLLFDPFSQFAILIVAFVVSLSTFPNHALTRFCILLSFFVLLSCWLLTQGIEPYSIAATAEDVWHRLLFGFAKAIWWLGGAMLLVHSVRMFLIFERRPKEARLAQDLIAGIIYVGAALSIVAYVFDVPVGTLIATSGVFAVILGLALQSTLSDVFSGVALNLGRPYAVGDWVVLDGGVQGRVMETSWRATSLLNGSNDLIVIPNSVLAKAQIVNLNSPDETHGITVAVKLVPTVPPARLEQMLHTALLGSNTILRAPQPLITVIRFSGSAVEFEVACRIRDFDQASTAKNELVDLIFRHARAANIAIAADSIFETPAAVTSADRSPVAALNAFDAMPLFSCLTPEEKVALAAALVSRTYARDATIIEQGAVCRSLVLITRGVVMVCRDEAGSKTELNRLSPGDFFGERGALMGLKEPGSISALTATATIEVAAERLAEIIKKRPTLAQEIGDILEERLDFERRLGRLHQSHSPHPESIAARIRHIFGHPHASL